MYSEGLLPAHVATRLYAPEKLSSGHSVMLDAAQAHRLRNVLRLGPGSTIAAFNERDGEWRCEIAEIGRNRARLHIHEQVRVTEAAADLWLVFAPIKRARLDWLVEKVTELGAAALVPVWTARTQPERLNRDRLRAEAISAAEQCERLSIPAVHEPVRLDRLLADWPPDRALLVCDETGNGTPIAAALGDFTVQPPVSAAVLIGPEGGFAETELDALGKLPIVKRVGLGPRVLRAETAALAALAVFQAVAGDWHRARRTDPRPR